MKCGIAILYILVCNVSNVSWFRLDIDNRNERFDYKRFNLYPSVNLAHDIIYRFSIFDTLRIREIRTAGHRIYRAAHKNANPHQSRNSRARPSNSDKTQLPGLRNPPYRKVYFFFLFSGSNLAALNPLLTVLNCKSYRSMDIIHRAIQQFSSINQNNRSYCNLLLYVCLIFQFF